MPSHQLPTLWSYSRYDHPSVWAPKPLTAVAIPWPTAICIGCDRLSFSNTLDSTRRHHECSRLGLGSSSGDGGPDGPSGDGGAPGSGSGHGGIEDGRESVVSNWDSIFYVTESDFEEFEESPCSLEEEQIHSNEQKRCKSSTESPPVADGDHVSSFTGVLASSSSVASPSESPSASQGSSSLPTTLLSSSSSNDCPSSSDDKRSAGGLIYVSRSTNKEEEEAEEEKQGGRRESS